MSLHRQNLGKVQSYGMSPLQIHERMARSGIVFQPAYEHPDYGLAMVQHLIQGGALYHSVDPQHAAGRHFGDGMTWGHLRTIWGMFRFRASRAEVDSRFAALTTFMFTLRAIFGAEGGWRMWQALWDEAFSDVDVAVDPAEPVAHLKASSPQTAGRGWDAWVPGYGQWIRYGLEAAADPVKTGPYLAHASTMPPDSFIRKAADGFIRLTYELPAQNGGGLISVGEGLPDLRDTILGEAAELSPWLFGGDDGVVSHGSETRSSVKGSGAEWSNSLSTLATSRYGRIPTYPLEGHQRGELAQLQPIQRFGYVRSGGVPHSGLDLPGGRTTPVVAMYDGKITALQSGQPEATHDASGRYIGPDPRGNYVSIGTEFAHAGKRWRVSHEYYHLGELPKLKRGDDVKAGSKLGLVGNTGNSHGPHLHLVVRIGELDDLGRSVRKWTLDPELVLSRGLVAAASAAGVPLGGVAKPSLSVGAAGLRAAASPGGLGGGMGGPGWDSFQAWTRETFDRVTDAAATAAAAVVSAGKTAGKATAKAVKNVDLNNPALQLSLAASLQALGVPAAATAPVLAALAAAQGEPDPVGAWGSSSALSTLSESQRAAVRDLGANILRAGDTPGDSQE